MTPSVATPAPMATLDPVSLPDSLPLPDLIPLSFDQTVVASYRSHPEAEEAIRLLAKNGLPVNKISLIGRHFETREEVQGFYRAADAAGEGANTGAWFGGVFGLLLGTGLFIFPLIGPLLMLGPFAGLVAGAIGGVGIGAIGGAGIGALVNGLMFLGVPRTQAIRYQERLETGEFLIVFYGARTADVEQAHSILQDTGHLSLETHGIFHGGVD